MDNNMSYQQPQPVRGTYNIPQPVNQMPQPQPQQITMPNNMTSQMYFPKICDFVQGDLGATIYQLNYFNQEATLIDIDDPLIAYRKSRDANGKLSPLKKYKLVPIEDKQPEQIDMSKYVKTDDIFDLITEAVSAAVQKEVDKRLSEISFKPASKEDK